MSSDLIKGLEAAGLHPIIVDENTDFSKLLGENPFNGGGGNHVRPRTPEGYFHKEAFCLMWYACVRRPDMKVREIAGVELRLSNLQGCGHRERIWNSRDGVTPFMTTCPSCGGDLQHEKFHLDMCVPDYTPHAGQKIWINMTKRRAEDRMRARMAYIKEHYPEEVGDDWDSAEYMTAVIANEWQEGQAPDLYVVRWDDDWDKVRLTLNQPE